MRLATFNIWWFGHPDRPRTDDEYARVADVIRTVAADVWVFQEIVDLERHRACLASAPPPSGGSWTTTRGGLPLATGGAQKVVIAFDAALWRCDAHTAIHLPHRDALAVSLRPTHGGPPRTVVGVHLKAGYPSWADPVDADERHDQAAALCGWLTGGRADAHPDLPQPDAWTAVAGDLNAPRTPVADDDVIPAASLAPLHALGWRWEDPEEDPAGGGRCSAWMPGERRLIDHVLLSPSWVPVAPPRLVAFDLHLPIEHRNERVSDHRPVVVTLPDAQILTSQ